MKTKEKNDRNSYFSLIMNLIPPIVEPLFDFNSLKDIINPDLEKRLNKDKAFRSHCTVLATYVVGIVIKDLFYKSDKEMRKTRRRIKK